MRWLHEWGPYVAAVLSVLTAGWKIATRSRPRSRWWDGFFDAIVGSYRAKTTERMLISSESEKAALIEEVATAAATNSRLRTRLAEVEAELADLRRRGGNGFSDSSFSATPEPSIPHPARSASSGSRLIRTSSRRSVKPKPTGSHSASSREQSSSSKTSSRR